MAWSPQLKFGWIFQIWAWLWYISSAHSLLTSILWLSSNQISIHINSLFVAVVTPFLTIAVNGHRNSRKPGRTYPAIPKAIINGLQRPFDNPEVNEQAILRAIATLQWHQLFFSFVAVVEFWSSHPGGFPLAIHGGNIHESYLALSDLGENFDPTLRLRGRSWDQLFFFMFETKKHRQQITNVIKYQ